MRVPRRSILTGTLHLRDVPVTRAEFKRHEAGEGKLELRLLYFVTEARQSAGRPTVITTNLDAKQLRDFLGSRIANRLMPLEVFAFTHGRNFRTPTGGTVWRS